MTVTVVVPTFNAARWIGDQLAALSEQAYSSEWELIVADNGSADDTCAIARSWEHAFPGLRILDASGGRGPAHNRNLGAREASGHLLLFTDVDDIVCPGWITHMAAGLENSSIVTGPVVHFVDGRTPSWDDAQLSKEHPRPGPFEPLIGCNMGIVRELFFALGGFNEDAPAGWDDTDLGLRATNRGVSITWVDQAVVLRRRPSSARAMWRKEFAYGRGWTKLERRYPQISPDGWVRPLLRRAGWVALRAPYVALASRRRGWVVRTAGLAGRVAERMHPTR
jgi:glycosyltransferase involved in cell wall biosynthesis